MPDYFGPTSCIITAIANITRRHFKIYVLYEGGPRKNPGKTAWCRTSKKYQHGWKSEVSSTSTSWTDGEIWTVTVSYETNPNNWLWINGNSILKMFMNFFNDVETIRSGYRLVLKIVLYTDMYNRTFKVKGFDVKSSLTMFFYIVANLREICKRKLNWKWRQHLSADMKFSFINLMRQGRKVILSWPISWLSFWIFFYRENW